MKRILPLLLLLALCLTAAYAEEVPPTPTPKVDSVIEGGYTSPATPTPLPTPELPPLRDDPMLLNVVEIAHRIDILAKNELFMGIYGYHGLSPEQIDAVAGGDHTRPVKVYHASGDALIDALFAGVPEDQRPDFGRYELLRDLVEEVPDMLWGKRESAELSILSTLARYKVFALPGAQGCGMFFLLYDDATPILVTWSAWNDAVDVAAFFMPDETLAAVSSLQEMADWFVGVGMPPIAFEEVPLT